MPSLYANIVSSNAVIQPNNNTSLYNPLGGNVIPVNGNINANNINVSNNVHVGGQISATGNIVTAGYFIGDGSQLSNIAGSYGNSNVAAFLPTYSGNLAGNNITLTGAAVATGNITTGGFYFGNGSQLTGITANYGNSNVAAFLPTYSGNISAGNIAVVNAITGANITASGQISATGDISTQGNLRTLGAQGNIVGANYVSANFFVGDGSLLTNVVATSNYSNANVTSLLAAFGSNTISTTGNISSGFFLGNGSQLTGIAASYGNANVATFMAAFGSNTISTSGNITGGNIIGNIQAPGANTQVLFNNNGIVSGNSNLTYSEATNLLQVNGGQIQAGNFNAGSGQVQALTGNLIQINSTTISASGNITGNYILGNGSQLTGLGATYSNADVTTLLASFGSNAISTTGNVTAGYFVGNGSLLTNITGANVTGVVANATFATSAGTATTAITADQANVANVANSVSGGNVSGQVANALVAGTVYTNAQPNITSVGTLSSLSVTGNVVGGNLNTAGNVTGSYILGDGSQLTNLPVQPGTYSNANVNAHLAAFGSNVISTTGNITGSNVNVSTVQATGSGGLALKNSAGTTQASLGAGGGDNFAINVSTNLNGNNAQIDISPTGTGHVHIKPTGTGAVEIAPTNTGSINNMIIGNVTPRAANVTTLGTTGNIAAAGILTDNYYYANGAPFSGGGGGTYGDANVNTLLAAWGSNSLLTTGNVKVGNIQLNGANGRIFTDGLLQTTNNGVIGGNLTVTGDVRANTSTGYFETVSANSNMTTQGTIAAAGNITSPSGNISVGGNVIGGNLLTTNQGALYLSELTSNGINKIEVRAPSNLATDLIFQLPNVNGSAGQYLATNGGGLLSWQGPATLGGSMTANIDGGNTFSLTNISSITGAVVSATGNITGANIIGNGQFLTNLPGANVTGTVANATTAGTVTTNAQPNITSVGTLTSLSATGNITGGNVTVNGANAQVVMAGSTSNKVNFGTTGFGPPTVGTYSPGAKVVLYDSLGPTNAGYAIGIDSGTMWFGTDIPGSNFEYFVGNAKVATIEADGRVTANAVTYTGTDGTVGQVLTTYGNGITYFSTVSGGSGSPGGANTQLQFNDGGAFAGNAAMTFDKTTGNIGLGNIVINTNQIDTVSTANLAATTASGQITPWRIQVGEAYLGNVNSAFSPTTPGTLATALNAPRLLVADFVTLPNTGMRFQEQTNMVWGNLGANISNTSTRFGAHRNEIIIGGGTSGFSVTATNVPTMATVTTNQAYVGAGTNANLSLIGNVAWSAGVAGMFNGVSVQPYSSANIIVGQVNQLVVNNANTSAFGNATTQIAYVSNLTGAPANANITATTTAVGYYMPGPTQIIPGLNTTNGNIARMATDYYAFRNDDDLARSKLGMLDRFHELNANTATTTGTVNIDKNSGQVQTIYPTGNVTIGTFSNFVTRVTRPNSTFVNTADTVTLIIQQGATPYTVTMPTGNTQIRYAAGVTTVEATANTTTMISITGVYDYTAAGNEYLITISPEFS